MAKISLFPASMKTKSGTKWGFINEAGKFVIDPVFQFAGDFQKNGLASVQKGNHYGCIDKNGDFVIKTIFDSTIEFSEGRAAVVYLAEYHVINEQGTLLTTSGFNFISMYQESRAMVSAKDQDGKYRYGYLDTAGKMIIPLKYEQASDFKDGVAVVKEAENRFLLIDSFGKKLQAYHYFFVGNYGDQWLVFQKGASEKYGYIDKGGAITLPAKYTLAQAFENGRAVVSETDDLQNNYGLINQAGTYLIPPSFNDVQLLEENRVAVGEAIDKEKPYLGSNYAVANWQGELLTDFLYLHISHFEQGIASVASHNKAFFIERSGNRARGLPVIEGADSVVLINHLIRALKNNRFVYFNRKGKLIWKQNTIIPLTSRYRVLEQSYQPNKDFLVYYPQIDGLKSEQVQLTVNGKLQQLANLKKINQDEQLDYTYTGDFNVFFFNKNLLVMELTSYQYYFGAAHGMPTKDYVQINMINGRFYKLADLFKENSHYVLRLSEIVAEMIKTDSQYDYVFPGSYKGISEDQPFYVDENNLFLYFAPYEIAPYAAGFPTFKIPYIKILDIIDKKGEFWLSFH